MIRFFTYSILLTLLFFSSVSAFAQDVQDSTTRDSILLKQIEQQMQTAPETTATQQRSGLSNNPDMGVIGDFQGSYDSRGKKNFDAYLNETEISLQSAIDPYIRGDFFLSMSRDPATGKYGINVEEGYLTTLSLPYRLQLKAGKFKEAVGKINPTHSHAIPFIDMPNAYVNYFGMEGLNDEGLSLSWLVPTKKFYQEIILQTTSGQSESPSFHRGDNNQFIYLAHLKNVFTLSDNATLEFGITGITGPNDSTSTTNIASADITYKWKPLQMNTYKSLTFQNEFYYGNANYESNRAHNSFGMYSMLQYQVAKRWFLTGRYDYAQKPYNSSLLEQATSLTTGWLATEFQKIELEVKMTYGNIQPTFAQAWVRWIFALGAHGAHMY